MSEVSNPFEALTEVQSAQAKIAAINFILYRVVEVDTRDLYDNVSAFYGKEVADGMLYKLDQVENDLHRERKELIRAYKDKLLKVKDFDGA